ncbi:MAG: hypothetical protein WBB01_08890 [Phormidesmis sp.]
MDRIQTQASELWEIIFSNETAATYQKALNLTGTILKEAAQLVWLVICSFFVFGAWVGDTSIKAGKNIRTWIDQQGIVGSAPTTSTPIAARGKSLLDTGRTGIAYLLHQAHEQLGVEEPDSVSAVEPSPSTSPQPTPPQPAKLTASNSIDVDGTATGDPQTDRNDIESAAASVPSVATSYGTGYSSTPRAPETEDDSWPPQEKEYEGG